MFGEGDKADMEMAKQAYAIVRGGVGPTRSLPHWSDLPEGMRMAFQFVAAHATLNERSACVKIVENWRDTSRRAGDLALKKSDVDDHQFHAQDASVCNYIAAAIRNRS